MPPVQNLLVSLINLFYPHTCEGCGRELTHTENILCMRCQHRLPATNFHLFADNPVEKIFWGRVNIRHAMAAYYYAPATILQRLIHRFKYHQRQDIALHLGRQMGYLLLQSAWLHEIDGIVPVPMHTAKAKRRGYNQAALLANGLGEIVQKQIWPHAMVRLSQQGSQTRRNRVSRWENTAGVFTVKEQDHLRGRHVLLIDDVITTGATTEACCHALIEAGALVSVCALAFTAR